jgi:hypothetical protein
VFNRNEAEVVMVSAKAVIGAGLRIRNQRWLVGLAAAGAY